MRQYKAFWNSLSSCRSYSFLQSLHLSKFLFPDTCRPSNISQSPTWTILTPMKPVRCPAPSFGQKLCSLQADTCAWKSCPSSGHMVCLLHLGLPRGTAILPNVIPQVFTSCPETGWQQLLPFHVHVLMILPQEVPSHWIHRVHHAVSGGICWSTLSNELKGFMPTDLALSGLWKCRF